MRILKVIRLSDEKDTSTSTEGQHEQIEKWAGERGHTVLDQSAEDTDISGRKVSPFKRPQLKQWLREPKMSEWDILVCSKQDRLFRSVADIGNMTKWCLENKKSWASVAENTDLSTPAGRMYANQLAVFAEFEADRGGERRAESAERLSRKGQWDGGTYPFGYMPKINGVAWTLVQSEYAPTVREMASRAIAGDSNGKIARWLNGEGIKTTRGNQWSPDVVGKLLRNPALAGWSVYRGAIVLDDDGNHVAITAEPVLDDDEWRALQAALDSRKQTRGERVGGHMLLRVAFCGRCSTDEKEVPIYGHLRQGRNRTNVYRCEKCGYSVPMGKLESQLEAIVMHMIGDKPLPRKVVIPAISHTAELEKVGRKIDELDDSFARGEIPARAYGRMMTRLEADQADLAAKPQRRERIEYVADPSGVTVREHWAGLDNEGRGKFLRQWGFRIWPDLDLAVSGDHEAMAEAFGLPA
jgi:site-specific DNA recombinase